MFPGRHVSRIRVRKYAHRYLAEAQYRFNRRFNVRSILARLLRAACLTTPTPAFAIRVAEVDR